MKVGSNYSFILTTAIIIILLYSSSFSTLYNLKAWGQLELVGTDVTYIEKFREPGEQGAGGMMVDPRQPRDYSGGPRVWEVDPIGTCPPGLTYIPGHGCGIDFTQEPSQSCGPGETWIEPHGCGVDLTLSEAPQEEPAAPLPAICERPQTTEEIRRCQNICTVDAIQAGVMGCGAFTLHPATAPLAVPCLFVVDSLHTNCQVSCTLPVEYACPTEPERIDP
jgi:hypothetical protein